LLRDDFFKVFEGFIQMLPIDLTRVKLTSLGGRVNKVALDGMAQPHRVGQTFIDFLASLPNLMAVQNLRAVVQAIVAARRAGRPFILGIGGHVIKCGLSPLLIDMMERKIVTALAMNGAAAIHDFEIALIGATSEDVAEGLKHGTFGMVRETGELMNQGINQVLEHPTKGMGELLGDTLNRIDVPYRAYSLMAAGRRLSVPITVHVAVGCDIIHMHPTSDGAAIGRASFNDFRLFAALVSELTGGVYLNIGSAVVMPEVFLKAFTIAQNLGRNLHDFVTVNMDMIPHYRPGENVVSRPALVGGRGYTLLGRHEIMVPLLAASLIEAFSGE
jgi:hypothetical protein